MAEHLLLILELSCPDSFLKEINVWIILFTFVSAEDEHKALCTNANKLHIQYKIPYQQANLCIFSCSQTELILGKASQ